MDTHKFVRKGERGRSPVGDTDEESDSSVGSLLSVTGSLDEMDGRAHRKRVRSRKMSEDGSLLDSDDDAEVPATKVVAVPKRGRGRPPTTGQYVGLAKAKAALVAAERQEMELRAEREVQEMTVNLRSQTSTEPRLSESSAGEPEELATDLTRKVLESVDTINSVATKSGNLKGTFQRALKVAASTIKEAMADLQTRSSTEETRRLQIANTRLREEVAELRKEIVELRRDVTAAAASAPPQASGSSIRNEPRPTEELEQAVLRQIGGMLNARFEALEGRLLPEQRARPPLAADRREKVSRKAPVPIPDLGLPGTSEGIQASSIASKGKKGKAKKNRQAAAPSQQTNPSAPVAQGKESWATVAKKGRKKGDPTASAPPQRQLQAKASSRQSQAGGGPSRRPAKAKPATPQLRVPGSAAIVLTLQPGAEEKGATYYDVLMEAKRRIDLREIGVTALNFREAATGGRILEVPGATSGDKADALAAKLREVFEPQHVRVSRPMKCADLRVTGLDDTATEEDVAAAIARVGECGADAVKANAIRRNAMGIGTTFVRCPVAAAKRVASSGRLQVGWISAQVRVLEPRPLRCFRCLELGHVQGKCTEDRKDRSGECYRCGQIGHKANRCSAEAHCSVCAAAGRPATHRLGGRACAEPKKKGGKAAKAKAKKPPARTAKTRAEESRMDAG